MPLEPKPDDEVGYGKPPKSTRFKKGQSGNPRGRPRGLKNTATILDEILNEPLVIRDGDGRRRKATKRKVILTQLVNGAAQGNVGSIKVLIPLMQQTEALDRRAVTPVFTEGDQKLFGPGRKVSPFRKDPQR